MSKFGKQRDLIRSLNEADFDSISSSYVVFEPLINGVHDFPDRYFVILSRHIVSNVLAVGSHVPRQVSIAFPRILG